MSLTAKRALDQANASRESLIYALTQALKGDDLPDAKVIISHYDAATGTMYCENNEQFSEVKIKEAQTYFTVVGERMRESKELDSRKKGEYCKIAEEAIKIMLSMHKTK